MKSCEAGQPTTAQIKQAITQNIIPGNQNKIKRSLLFNNFTQRQIVYAIFDLKSLT